MTKEQAAERYNRIIRKCYRDLCGGTSFGLDWATLKILYPDRYSALKRLEAEMDQ